MINGRILKSKMKSSLEIIFAAMPLGRMTGDLDDDVQAVCHFIRQHQQPAAAPALQPRDGHDGTATPPTPGTRVLRNGRRLPAPVAPRARRRQQAAQMVPLVDDMVQGPEERSHAPLNVAPEDAPPARRHGALPPPHPGILQLVPAEVTEVLLPHDVTGNRGVAGHGEPKEVHDDLMTDLVADETGVDQSQTTTELNRTVIDAAVGEQGNIVVTEAVAPDREAIPIVPRPIGKKHGLLDIIFHESLKILKAGLNGDMDVLLRPENLLESKSTQSGHFINLSQAIVTFTPSHGKCSKTGKLSSQTVLAGEKIIYSLTADQARRAIQEGQEYVNVTLAGSQRSSFKIWLAKVSDLISCYAEKTGDPKKNEYRISVTPTHDRLECYFRINGSPFTYLDAYTKEMITPCLNNRKCYTKRLQPSKFIHLSVTTDQPDAVQVEVTGTLNSSSFRWAVHLSDILAPLT